MKLKRVQGLLTTAMGKRPQEVGAPSLADSPARQAALVQSTELSRSFGNWLALNTTFPSEWTASVATMRSNTPGVPSAVSSAPSPPVTAAASPTADESCVEIRSLVGIVPSDPIQSEERLEEALLRDSISKFDPSEKRFLDRSPQLVTTSSDLHNDSTIRRGSNLAGTSFLKKFIENEGGTSRICDTSATEVKTGTMDTGNAVVPSSFKICRNTRVLLPSQRVWEKSTNQWLLRCCLQNPTVQRDLQQGIQTHEAVLQSIVFQGPPLISSCESDDVKTGTLLAGNAVVPCSAFKAWQKTRVLSPSQRIREKSTNQRLLRRCFENLTLQRLQTHGVVKLSSVSQARPLISSINSNIFKDMDMASFLNYIEVNPQGTRASSMPHHDDTAERMMIEERRRRSRQKKNFAALRSLVPVISKSDKASILGDAVTYLKDLKRENHELEARKNQVERQYEDLKLSYQDLEQRNQQLEASKRQAEHQHEDLKFSLQDLEQRNRRLVSEVEDEFEDSISSYQEHRKKRQEARKNQVKNEFDEIL